MYYCVHCSLNLTKIERENVNMCPICENEVREIKNQKLVELMNEVNSAVAGMQSTTVKNQPKLIIEIAKTIEKAEKKFSKEYTKRIEQLKELNYELEVIRKFSGYMNYSLEETSEQSTEDSNAELIE